MDRSVRITTSVGGPSTSTTDPTGIQISDLELITTRRPGPIMMIAKNSILYGAGIHPAVARSPKNFHRKYARAGTCDGCVLMRVIQPNFRGK